MKAFWYYIFRFLAPFWEAFGRQDVGKRLSEINMDAFWRGVLKGGGFAFLGGRCKRAGWWVPSPLGRLARAEWFGASDGAEPNESPIVTDALVVDNVGRHHSNLPRCARHCRQLLGVAVNVVASAAPAAGLCDDAVVLAASNATPAKAQIEPSTSSSLPILPRPSGWRLSGADSAARATNASVRRPAWQVPSRIGVLVLGHRRSLCDNRVFEPPALSRFTACSCTDARVRRVRQTTEE